MAGPNRSDDHPVDFGFLHSAPEPAEIPEIPSVDDRFPQLPEIEDGIFPALNFADVGDHAVDDSSSGDATSHDAALMEDPSIATDDDVASEVPFEEIEMPVPSVESEMFAFAQDAAPADFSAYESAADEVSEPESVEPGVYEDDSPDLSALEDAASDDVNSAEAYSAEAIHEESVGDDAQMASAAENKDAAAVEESTFALSEFAGLEPVADPSAFAFATASVEPETPVADEPDFSFGAAPIIEAAALGTLAAEAVTPKPKTVPPVPVSSTSSPPAAAPVVKTPAAAKPVATKPAATMPAATKPVVNPTPIVTPAPVAKPAAVAKPVAAAKTALPTKLAETASPAAVVAAPAVATRPAAPTAPQASATPVSDSASNETATAKAADSGRSKRGAAVERKSSPALMGYAIALTLFLIFCFFTGRLSLFGNATLESLPDLRPLAPNEFRKVPDGTPVPDGHVLHLGESRRFGDVVVTPTRVTREALKFQRFDSGVAEESLTTGPVLKLWLKFENVSGSYAFPPFDAGLMSHRTPPFATDSAVKANTYLMVSQPSAAQDIRVLNYLQTMDSNFVLQQQESGKVVLPEETLETFVACSEEIADIGTTADSNFAWRIQFRKGVNETSGNGVTTLIDVRFAHADISEAAATGKTM